MSHALSLVMATALSVDELLVYQKALQASKNISNILKRPSLQRDLRLREQMASSSERAASLISEGFEQSTDRHFAEYCYRSRGATREIRTQLVVARDRGHVEDSERLALTEDYAEIAKMLTGLIRHLERTPARRRR